MAYQCIPARLGELESERYVDKMFAGVSPSLEDQRAVKTVHLEAEYQTDEFKIALEQFSGSSFAIKSLPKGFDIEAAHSWSDVIEMGREAQERYERGAKGPAGAGRRLFRFIGAHASAIEPWIDMLPSDSYGSVICGALKVGLGLLAFRQDLCERISNTIDGLNDMLLKIGKMAKLYSKDMKMREIATRTYVCLLAMIQAIILKLDDKAFTKFWEAVSRKERRKKTTSGVTLEDKEKNFYAALQEMHEHAEYLHQELAIQTKQHLKKFDYEINRHLLEQDRNMSTGFKGLHQEVQTVGKTVVDEVSLNQVNISDALYAKIAASIQDEISRLLMYQYQQREYDYSLERRRLEASTPQPAARPSFLKERLLTSLLASDVHASSELAAASKAPLLLDKPFQAHMHQLLQSPRLRAFLSSHTSSLLPLTCATEPYADGLFTPLSIVAKALIDATTTTPPPAAQSSTTPIIHALHFFAGFHTTSDDPLAGPVGLLRSLLVQLLRLPGLADIDDNHHDAAAADNARATPSLKDLVDDVRRASASPFPGAPYDQARYRAALCNLLTGLLRRLPDGTVLFVVIDGVALLARDVEMEGEMCAVIGALRECVGDMGWHAVLKIVLTFCGAGGLVGATGEDALRLEGEEEGWEGEGGDEEDVEDTLVEMVGAGEAGDVAFEEAVGRYVVTDEFE